MKLLDDSNNQNFHTPTNGNTPGTTLGIKITPNNKKQKVTKSPKQNKLFLYIKDHLIGDIPLPNFINFKRRNPSCEYLDLHAPTTIQTKPIGWDGMGWDGMHERMDGWMDGWDPI